MAKKHIVEERTKMKKPWVVGSSDGSYTFEPWESYPTKEKALEAARAFQKGLREVHPMAAKAVSLGIDYPDGSGVEYLQSLKS